MPTVGYDLAAARADDPALAAEHEIAAGTARQSVTTRGLARMNELITMVKETGHIPSEMHRTDYRASNGIWPPHSTDAGPEQYELLLWVQKQRIKLLRDELDSSKSDELDQVLPGWRIP